MRPGAPGPAPTSHTQPASNAGKASASRRAKPLAFSIPVQAVAGVVFIIGPLARSLYTTRYSRAPIAVGFGAIATGWEELVEPVRRVLILGGTTEARELAALLEEAGIRTLTSLAGVTRHPMKPAGAVRLGGFGGVAGLTDFLARERPDAVCDATHPFAARMSQHAAEAATAVGIPLLRLERPPWEPQPGDDWLVCDDIAAAADAVPPHARVFLTIGRKEAPRFLARADLAGVARMIEPLGREPPPGWRIILDRPPYPLGAEIQLFETESFTVLVTKNSGGEVMRTKLDAARANRVSGDHGGASGKAASSCGTDRRERRPPPHEYA